MNKKWMRWLPLRRNPCQSQSQSLNQFQSQFRSQLLEPLKKLIWQVNFSSLSLWVILR